MTIQAFIAEQAAERRALLTAIHQIIVENDKNVVATIEPMMGKEMIIYKAGTFKYGLASVKNHMSLHVLPIYGAPDLYAKYQALLPNAVFQKGCINFKSADEVPAKIIRKLIADCSAIDLQAIREAYLQSKKKKA